MLSHTGCSEEDQPEVMDDRDGWRKRELGKSVRAARHDDDDDDDDDGSHKTYRHIHSHVQIIVPPFQSYINLCGLFNTKNILVEEQQGYSSTHSWGGGKRVSYFFQEY